MPSTSPGDGLAASGEAADLLAATGWDPGGGRPTGEDLRLLAAAGYDPVEATRALLAQVSGIRVTRPALPPKRKPRIFHFDLAQALATWGKPNLEMAGIDAQDDLCLVGAVDSERLFLAVDTTGGVFAGNGNRLYRLGSSAHDALQVLLSHTGPEQWERAVAPPMEPYPVLVTADPPRAVSSAQEAATLAVTAPGASTGPVIGVADWGDVWRVYRSSAPIWVRPPFVPLLVSKDTGDVLQDWPLRRDGPSAQDGYRQLLEALTPHLRRWGFTGSQAVWRRVAKVPETLRFRVLPGATAASLTFEAGLTSGEPPSQTGWCATTVDGLSVYWHVLAGVDVRFMVEAVRTVLEPNLRVRQQPDLDGT